MRDSSRLKEKIDLSLDNRQLVSLALGGLVVLGAVFVVGVVVGKKLAASEGASQAPDLLAALDQRAAALDEAKDASLTFQEELTRKVVAQAAPPAPSVVAPLPKPKPDPAPQAAPKPPEPAPTAQVPPPTALAAAPAPAEVEEEPAQMPEEAVPTRTALKDGGGLREAIARAQRPAEAVPNGAFTLQLSASQDKGEADRFVARLRGQGYAPYIAQADVPGRGTWYRVRMGSFPSKEAAGRYLQDFRRETRLEAFVAGIDAR